MTANDRDDVLHERFQRLRAEEAESAPEFEAMLARAQAEAQQDGSRVVPIASARSRRGRVLLALSAGTLAAAALAGVLLIQPDADDREFEALVTAYASESGLWRSPTDELLRVPGRELLNTVPTVGWPYGTSPEGAGERPAPESDVMG